ncbi:MAG: hypothetical protein KKG75_01435 [Nanoarchaeota archaeon]|nr:hypothetical protein [Nanoarchaeota archaeon]
MLDEKRIKEAEVNVKSYLEDGLLKKAKDIDFKILEVLKNNSKESLKVANMALKESSLWTIVCSYYSMYYIANAVLYKFSYKVGDKISHKVTSDALIVFIRNKLKKKLIEEFEKAKEEALEIAGLRTDSLLQSFDFEREKRSKIQYNMTEKVKKSKAKTSLERAKLFVFEIEKLL